MKKLNQEQKDRLLRDITYTLENYDYLEDIMSEVDETFSILDEQIEDES